MGQTQSGTGPWTGSGSGRWSGADVEAPPVTGKPANAYARLQRNAATLVRDVLRLLDLQFQLLGKDVQEGWRHARLGLALGVLGAVAMLAALPVLLFGIAEYVRNAFDVSLEFALVLISCLVILTGGGLALWSLKILTSAGSSLNRSQEELRENLIWFRSVLNQDEN